MGFLEEINKDWKKIQKGIERDHKNFQKEQEKLLKKFLNIQVPKSIREEKRKPLKASTKKEVYDKFKGRCNKCSKKNPLEIHHKDMKNSNNRLSNLVLLCPNHHTLEHQKYYKKVFAKEYHKKNSKSSSKKTKKSPKKKQTRRTPSLFGNSNWF
jgi:hypothetical protein